MKQLVIDLTEEQFTSIREHLTRNARINAAEETFTGYSFTLSCTEDGLSWLEVEMNSKIEVGDVSWRFEE